jgi:DNA-binding transcriptional LysR family regulator
MLEELFTFVSVVKLKNFTQAATELGLSTSSVTRRIENLESALGSQLINRTTRQVCLTEAGQIFYQSCLEIIQTYDATKASLSSLNATLSGTLKIGMPMSISQLHITPLLSDLLKENENLNIHIVNGNHLMDLLSNGFDMVIHCGQLPDSNFHFKRLGTWQLAVYASPGYLKQHGKPETPDDLSHHNCLDHSDNHVNAWIFSVDKLQHTVSINGNFKANSSMDLKNLALKDVGIICVPSFTVTSEVNQSKLVEILKPFQAAPIDISVVYPRRDFLNQKTKMMIALLDTWARSDNSGVSQ